MCLALSCLENAGDTLRACAQLGWRLVFQACLSCGGLYLRQSVWPFLK